MTEVKDLYSDYDSYDFGSHNEAALQMQGEPRSPGYKARLYLKTRIHMVMQLRNCTFGEALRYVEEHKIARRR